jgi:hypothetical protein
MLGTPKVINMEGTCRGNKGEDLMDGRSSPSRRDSILDGWMRSQKIAALSPSLFCKTLVTPLEDILLNIYLIYEWSEAGTGNCLILGFKEEEETEQNTEPDTACGLVRFLPSRHSVASRGTLSAEQRTANTPPPPTFPFVSPITLFSSIIRVISAQILHILLHSSDISSS